MDRTDALIRALKNADAAGDTQAARTLAREIQRTRQPVERAPAVEPQPEPSYSPSDGMSAGEKFLVGAGAAVSRAGRGIGELLNSGNSSMERFDTTGRDARVRQNLQQGADDAQAYQQHHPGGWATAGEMGADIAMTALPLGAVVRAAPAIKAGAAALGAGRAAAYAPAAADIAANAAAGAAMTPGDAQERARSAAWGAGGAAAGRAAGSLFPRALARLSAPAGRETENVRLLRDAGVQPTFGQVMRDQGPIGRQIGRAEDALMSVPGGGHMLAARRAEAVEQFQRGTRAQALPPGAHPSAANSVDDLGAAFTEAYGRTLKGRTFNAAHSFDLDGSVQRATADVPMIDTHKAQAQQFARQILDAHMLPDVKSAQAAQQAESVLKREASNLRASQDPMQRNMGEALRRIADDWRNHWRNGLDDTTREGLKGIDSQYREFVPVRRAAAKGNLEDPDAYSPKQLLGAIRAGDRTPNKTGFIRGDEPMQDLARAGSELLPSKMPDSGTAGRLAMGGLLGGTAVAGMSPAVAATMLGTMGYSTKRVQRYLTRQMPRSEWRAMDARIRQMTQAGGRVGGAAGRSEAADMGEQPAP